MPMNSKVTAIISCDHTLLQRYTYNYVLTVQALDSDDCTYIRIHTYMEMLVTEL